MKLVKGFTLVEMLIVMAVIGILASIALPAYSSYVLRGKFAEATSSLTGTRVKMEQYYQDNRTYAAAGCVTPVTLNFTITCINVTATTYTVQAAGIAAQGTGGFTFTLDQDNNKATAGVAGGWSTPSPNNCWVQKKGGQC